MSDPVQLRFPYHCVKTTGVLHLFVGSVCLLTCGISLGEFTSTFHGLRVITYFFIGALLTSAWVLLVGTFGILTGMRSASNGNGRKATYLTLAILSALVVSPAGILLLGSVTVYLYDQTSLYIGALIGMISMFVEFILAVVSSSICCCYLKKHRNPLKVESTSTNPQLTQVSVQSNPVIQTACLAPPCREHSQPLPCVQSPLQFTPTQPSFRNFQSQTCSPMYPSLQVHPYFQSMSQSSGNSRDYFGPVGYQPQSNTLPDDSPP